MKRIHNLTALTAVDRLLEPLRRWVFGSGREGQGYVLSHPKVGEYLQRNRFTNLANELRQGFAEWGKAHAVALNGQLRLEQPSAYCLQYLPEHLKQARASPHNFMFMVEDGWRRAWENLEGGQRGFASDELLSEALAAAKDVGHERGLIRTVAELASHLASKQRDEVLSEALAAAKAIGDEDGRSQVVAAFAPHFTPEQLIEALAAAQAINDEFYYAMALTALASYLAPKQKDEALSKALAIALAIIESEASNLFGNATKFEEGLIHAC